MEDEKTKDTYIRDSNVDILIENSSSTDAGRKSKQTDYLPIIIIAVVMIGIVVYYFAIRHGARFL